MDISPNQSASNERRCLSRFAPVSQSTASPAGGAEPMQTSTPNEGDSQLLSFLSRESLSIGMLKKLADVPWLGGKRCDKTHLDHRQGGHNGHHQ